MDLTTKYMGLDLPSPLVPSASPLSQSLDKIRVMEDSGAGAVVLWSLFEEQIQHDVQELDYYLQHGADRWAESLTYFPKPKEFHLGPEEYLAHVAGAKKAVKIPIIASLNGISTGGWTSYARQIEQAGADGLELNVYFIPTDQKLSGTRVENVYLSVLKAVRSTVSIPVAMKLSPYFSSTANMMRKLDRAGADALVLFNRFYQPDIDLKELEVRPHLVLSSSVENRLPLRWTAILFGKVKASLAVTSGIHTGQDAAKAILAGADAVQMCSALLTHGPGYLKKVREDLITVMNENGYGSPAQMRGILSQKNCPEPAVFERANYMKTLSSYGHTATFE